MKLLFSFLFIALLCGSMANMLADHHETQKALRHVVAFKWKEGAAKEDIQKVVDAFAALKKSIPQIQALEWGTNVSPETHDKGFTHMWTLTFKSAEDRDAYLVHPEHKKFGRSLGPVLGDVFVIDYWAETIK